MKRARAASIRWLAVATVCAAACRPHPSSHDAATARRIDAGPVRHEPASHAPDAAVAVAPGPSGGVEGTVYLDGPIRRGPPITVAPAWQSHPGCRDAALRYAQPFDISQPGPFPGALVSADAHERTPPEPHERRMNFRDCDITPRALFAHIRDHILFHSETRLQVLPHVIGSGAVIDRLLIPGQADVEVHLPGPGIFPVTVRTLPEWVGARLYVLANRFIDTTDAAGHFRITDIPPGNVLVHAWYPGAVEAHEVVAIRANETAHVDFHIHQAPPPHVVPVDAGPVPP